MKTKTFLLLAVITLLTTNSCKKYPEDDESMHLKSPEKRLVRYPWDCNGVLNFITNKQVYTIGCASGDISFASNSFSGDSDYFNYDGTWELTDRKKKIKIMNGTTGEEKVYVIQKLDKTELALRDDSLQYNFKAHLIK